MQGLEPKSPAYGNFHRTSLQKNPLDLNVIEFVSEILGLIHNQSRDRLSEKARAQLTELMTTAVDRLKIHTVRVSHANIWLKKTWRLIALGEALECSDIADPGYAQLDTWLRFTAQNGITEFNAVTCYGINLDSLGLIANYARRAEGRGKAMAAIRYFWTETAANWRTAGNRLGGANSRSYDYLFARGYFDVYVRAAGWILAKPKFENTGWIGPNHDNPVAFHRAAHVSVLREWIDSIRSQIPRTVVQRWGAEPENTATNWVGPPRQPRHIRRRMLA
jgi:hypothetical protein